MSMISYTSLIRLCLWIITAVVVVVVGGLVVWFVPGVVEESDLVW